LELDAELILTVVVAANAIAAKDAANASIAIAAHVVRADERMRRCDRAICCLAESNMGLPFADGAYPVDADARLNLPARAIVALWPGVDDHVRDVRKLLAQFLLEFASQSVRVA